MFCLELKLLRLVLGFLLPIDIFPIWWFVKIFVILNHDGEVLIEHTRLDRVERLAI